MNINIKLKYSYIVKLIYGLIVLTFITVAYLLVSFLDTNFYQVITQSEDIVVLRKEVATEIIDAALFEKILAHLSEKQKPLPFNVGGIKDIFSSSSEQSESGGGNFKSPKSIDKIPDPNNIQK